MCETANQTADSKPQNRELVTNWTKRFYEMAFPNDIFGPVQASPFLGTQKSVLIIGNQWHQFSQFMPWFLCQAAANVSTNAARTAIARIAWEELGSGIRGEIHADQFLDCVKIAGSESVTIPLPGPRTGDLEEALLKSRGNDSYIFGMCLGLEIVAIENIETIFESLAVSTDVRRVNEEGHIEHSVNNFLRFCLTDHQKQEFMKGFHLAVNFWQNFWHEAASQLAKEIDLSA